MSSRPRAWRWQRGVCHARSVRVLVRQIAVHGRGRPFVVVDCPPRGSVERAPHRRRASRSIEPRVGEGLYTKGRDASRLRDDATGEQRRRSAAAPSSPRVGCGGFLRPPLLGQTHRRRGTRAAAAAAPS
eukprot:12925223-Alexandrium_andersonii.AAC.1